MDIWITLKDYISMSEFRVFDSFVKRCLHFVTTFIIPKHGQYLAKFGHIM